MASLWNGTSPLFWPQTEGPAAQVWDAEALPSSSEKTKIAARNAAKRIETRCLMFVPPRARMCGSGIYGLEPQ
ncbi:MAG: hypothetical protein DME11_00720 [Candidatus Rokuibacteriota bacterium]|nr:MAG: hypothetical protein DME11_00720 [Candidatus Rokubacteria bacterium]